MGKLISSDPITKTTRSFHKGQRDGEEYYIYNEQDVTHIIEKNKAPAEVARRSR
jgi:guanylate kinase